jgi:zinc/manganese transport system ATP-binding protein
LGIVPHNTQITEQKTCVRMASTKVAIRLERVSTVYEGERRPAIRDITLTLETHELVYVVGPNASGKTTLLETINGLLPPFKGHITVFGLNVKTHGGLVRRETGYVPQDFMVEPGEPYTAFDIVMMGRYGKIGLLNKPNEQDREKVMDMMKLLEIDELAQRPMGKLSGGQQQKVMIARALAKEPKILLLDEPFSNLDPEARQKIPSLIHRLHEKHELTTLIVTHDVHDMIEACCRVVVINNGRIVADDTPTQALDEWRRIHDLA